MHAFAIDSDCLINTQNDETKMMLIEIAEYERHQEALALLKLLALGNGEIEEGKFSDAHAFLDEMDD